MKIKLIKSTFVTAMKHVQNVTSKKPTLQIVANVHMVAKDNELTLTATDLDVSCIAKVACEVVEEGATTLPARLLLLALQKMPEGEVEIDSNMNDIAKVLAGNSVYNINGLPAKDFPALPVIEDPDKYTLPQVTLREMFRKVVYATSKDETRRILKGVLMSFKDGKLTMVGTDGRRLSLIEYGLETNGHDHDIILPPNAIGEVVGSLGTDGDCEIAIEGCQVSFTMGNVKVYSKLIDDIYPNYGQVIPKDNDKSCKIDRAMFAEAIDRVAIFSDAATNATVKFSLKDGEMTITSATHDVGDAKDVIPVKFDGELEILFNPFYILDVLKAIDDDEVDFVFKNGASPVIIKCSVPFLGVVMPVRIN